MEELLQLTREELISRILDMKEQIRDQMIVEKEKVLALEAQKEAECRYRELLKRIQEVVYIMDSGSRLIYISPRVYDLFGYSPQELLGQKFYRMFHPDDCPGMREKESYILAGNEVSMEFRILDKRGQVHLVHGTCKSLKGTDDQVVLTGIITDITEKKKSQAALLESEMKFRFLEENIQDVIFIMDLDFNYIYVSPSVYKIRGYTADEVRSNGIKKYLTPERLKQFRNYLDEELRIDRENLPRDYSYRLIEIELTSKENTRVIIESKVSFLRDDNDEVVGIIGVTRDITERKKLQEEMERSLREKEILLKEIHHRVKNNFQIITSLLNLQENRIHDNELLEIYRDSQNRIRAMALIHEKLYQSDNLAQIDLAEYIHILAGELFDTYECSTDRIELRFDTTPVLLEIDQAIPCGLLINEILTNAIKYAFPPYFSEKREIVIHLSSNPDGQIIIAISDNGIGIPETVDMDKPATLGLQLITMISQNQLRGVLRSDRNWGTSFHVTFNRKAAENSRNPIPV